MVTLHHYAASILTFQFFLGYSTSWLVSSSVGGFSGHSSVPSSVWALPLAGSGAGFEPSLDPPEGLLPGCEINLFQTEGPEEPRHLGCWAEGGWELCPRCFTQFNALGFKAGYHLKKGFAASPRLLCHRWIEAQRGQGTHAG